MWAKDVIGPYILFGFAVWLHSLVTCITNHRTLSEAAAGVGGKYDDFKVKLGHRERARMRFKP